MIQGKITDKHTGQPIAYAPVYCSDEQGNEIKSTNIMQGSRTASGIDGNYQLQTDNNQFITVTHQNYKSMILPADKKIINFELTSINYKEEKPTEINAPQKESFIKRNKGLIILGTIIGILIAGFSIFGKNE